MAGFERPADHAERMEQMEARAQWEFGDPAWAGVLFAAYEAPDADRDALRQEANP